MKRILAAALCLVMVFAFMGAMPVRADAAKTVYLTLAHNMAEDHAINVALTEWAEAVNEATGGAIELDVMPGGTLGSEADCVSQIQAGQLEMTKVSAGTLANFNSAWNCVSVPYVFTSKDHLYNVMNGEIGQDLFALSEGDGFVGLAWLESGTRCFYTAKTPIRTPSDLKGLKIRTMDSQMAIDMMNAFGGSATVMGYGDIYTGMQQGVIDGAENNITAMRDHADVTQYYCYDEHTMIPDVIIISADIWNSLTPEQQEIMKSTAADMVANYKQLWAQFEEDVKAQVEGKVEYVTDVDKAAFQEAVKGIYEKLEKDSPDTYAFVKRIQEAG
jgi:tripartite ATP-independent transporter DctP family solute receptor